MSSVFEKAIPSVHNQAGLIFSGLNRTARTPTAMGLPCGPMLPNRHFRFQFSLGRHLQIWIGVVDCFNQ